MMPEDESYYTSLAGSAEDEQIGIEAFAVCMLISFLFAVFLVHTWLEFEVRQ
jgi:hypothetical protein